jgi:hypothetical protein
MGVVWRNTPSSSFLKIRDKCIAKAVSVAAPDEVALINAGIKPNLSTYAEAQFSTLVSTNHQIMPTS